MPTGEKVLHIYYVGTISPLTSQSNSLESYRFLELLILSKWYWVLMRGQDQIEPTVYKLDSCIGLVTDAIISSLSLSVLRNSEITL